jgi:hypothetical protein
MDTGSWIALWMRQAGTLAPLSWDDLVVGHDFGFLGPQEIQAWLRDQGPLGPRGEALASLPPEGALRFEEMLWAASGEATGKVPRPGGGRWAKAQDRWRVVLLKDIMEAPLSAEALAVAVESIYERVGCPEDMLGLWQRVSPWEKRPGIANREAIQSFLERARTAIS